MHKFEGEMQVLNENYKDLEKKDNELQTGSNLQSEFDSKLAELRKIRGEVEKMNVKHKNSLDFYLKMKERS